MDWNTYDLDSWRTIQTWQNPKESFWQQITKVIDKPLETLSDVAFDNQVGRAVQDGIQGVITILNDAASWTVRDKAILAEFRGNGYEVECLPDLRQLPLESVDKVVGYLGAKYRSWGAAEGAAMGALGLPGLAADIPLTIALNLRCICEFATYYGFDIQTEHERAYAVHVLAMSSASSAAAKEATLAQLNRIAVAVAKKKAWADLEKILGVAWIRQIAEALGIRLTKAKLGQAVPVIGAAIGGGVNGYLMHCTIEAASNLYRQRFLLNKYGAPPVVQ